MKSIGSVKTLIDTLLKQFTLSTFKFKYKNTYKLINLKN